MLINIIIQFFQHCHFQCYMSLEAVLVVTSSTVVHGANMGPTWVLSAPDEPHVGPMNDRGSPFRGYASTKHHTVNSALSSEFVSSTAFSTRSWTSSATERNNESSVFRPMVKRIIRTYPSKVLGDDAFSVWSCRKKNIQKFNSCTLWNYPIIMQKVLSQ